MKKILILLSLFVSVVSCMNNDYLEKLPLDKQTEESTFKNYNGFKTYSWNLYEVFDAYKNLGVLYDPECDADNMFVGTANAECRWAWNKVIVPTSDGGWNYDFIRRTNVMLDRVDAADMTDAEKLHWRAVGLFFRSFKYADMLSKFGDVVWVETSLNENSPELYLPRDNRDLVADNILRDLLFARDNVKVDGDGRNTINRDVVNAFISRFGLFEGTWRKYHGLKNGEKFLQESKVASEELIKKFPNLHPNYDEMFNSVDLVGMDGVILARQYVMGLQGHSISRLLMSSTSRYELSKDAVDSYLCSDGLPITKSSLFEGDRSPYTEFRSRDLRLLFTTCPPYRVSTPPAAFETKWWHTEDKADAEYFSVMESISKEKFKRFPILQNGGSVLKFSPHFTKHNGGFGFQVSEGGYWVYKHLNHHETYPVTTNGSDAPIFRMGEVLANYAEVMFELELFNQNVADQSINKLRARALVASMDVAAIDDNFDPNRDKTIDPILWEIRRERRVELMGDGFRFNDIRRWKKGEYTNKQKLGRWYSKAQLVKDGVIKKEADCKIKFVGGGKEGYIEFFGDPVKQGKGWKDYFYLYPLPLADLGLNPKLEQNPIWK